MNFVSTMPTSTTGFEYKLYQIFGTSVSPEAFVAVAAFIAVSLLFKSSLTSSGLR